jgi:hypothetical protein
MSMFGLELPTPVNFVIAFVFVLMLIGAAAWLVRRFGVTRMEATTRGRQPRLAVIDFASVDGRRKLIIIRRDNVEHLLMIGGPSDVVVETNIVRGAASTTRDQPTVPSRVVPIPDPTPWPLQPEPVAPVVPAMPTMPPPATARTARAPSDEAWQTPVEPAVPPMPTPAPAPEIRPVRPPETLVGLAEDLARPTEPVAIRPVQVQPQRIAAAQPAAGATVPTDQSLAEMAQRLEAALRRPMAQRVTAETPRVTATLDVKAVPAAPPKAAAVAQQRSGGAQPKPQGDLEQEMASLLSRPGKT